MLILTRRVGEKIIIGDDIEVVVGGINKSSQVKICIGAPDNVKILRSELIDRPRKEPVIKIKKSRKVKDCPL